jgi:hypothetical protein
MVDMAVITMSIRFLSSSEVSMDLWIRLSEMGKVSTLMLLQPDSSINAPQAIAAAHRAEENMGKKN